jgi:hypothetical protein
MTGAKLGVGRDKELFESGGKQITCWRQTVRDIRSRHGRQYRLATRYRAPGRTIDRTSSSRATKGLTSFR